MIAKNFKFSDSKAMLSQLRKESIRSRVLFSLVLTFCCRSFSYHIFMPLMSILPILSSSQKLDYLTPTFDKFELTLNWENWNVKFSNKIDFVIYFEAPTLASKAFFLDNEIFSAGKSFH